MGTQNLENRQLYARVLETARKAAIRDRALNAKDTAAVCDRDPEPMLLGSLLLKMRKRGTLKPSDLTELRVAVKEEHWGRSEFGFDFEQTLSETWLENEQRKETPRKRD